MDNDGRQIKHNVSLTTLKSCLEEE